MDENLKELWNHDDFTFEEAAEYLGEKLSVTPKQFAKLGEKYKSLAFTVSGYSKVSIINEFRKEVLKAIEDGTTLHQFRKNMNIFLENKGYEGLTPFQADNIFRTNIQTAFQVGHYDRMQEVKDLRPFWQYDAVGDEQTRPSHLAMDGRVFRADSPVWDTWYPPNGYRCRCTVRTLSARQVAAMGLTVEEEAPVMAVLPDGKHVNLAPDKKFNTNPAKTRFDPDMEGYPKVLQAAYKRQMQNKPNEAF